MTKKQLIGSLRDLNTHQTLAEISNSLETRLWHSRKPLMIWCASPDNKFNDISECLRKGLGIDEKSVLNFCLAENQADLRYCFRDMKRDSLPGELSLLRIYGFAGISSLHNDNGFRVGHDYDQYVVESWGKYFADLLPKRFAILTHIGHSAGEDSYKKAYFSAMNSQFKTRFCEFE